MSARLVPNQDELTAAHGTPWQFAAAVWRAYEDLFITLPEAEKAIAEYSELWNAAGKQEARPVIV